MPLTNSAQGGKTTMIGLDTGYFLKLLKGDAEAIKIWTAIMDGEEAAVSCLTLFELARFARKGSIEAKAERTLREGILGLCRVCWLDREAALLAAANLSHGIGLHAMDAIILSGLLSEKATTIYTTDSDFEAYKKRGVRIVRI
jgi:predicted nucleic acid-binding protein